MDKKRENSRFKKAYASLAALKQGRPGKKLRIIIVAGKYGKTTTIQLLREVLFESGKKVAEMTASENDKADFQHDIRVLQTNLNSAVKQNVDYVIIEANQALIDSHAFATMQIDTLIITSESEVANQLLGEQYQHVVMPWGFEVKNIPLHNQVTFGFDEKADMSIRDVKLYRRGTELKIVIDQHNEVDIASFLIGRANAENVAAALAAAYVMGVKVEHFAEGIAKIESVAGNFEYLETTNKKDYLVALETGLTDESIAKTIASAHDVVKRRLLIALAKSTTDDKLREYKHYADRLVYVGQTEARGITTAVDAEEAATVAIRAARKDDIVLLIGEPFAKEMENEKTLAANVAEKMAS